jgi:subfamily B ATP-binding cassette protein MsbA
MPTPVDADIERQRGDFVRAVGYVAGYRPAFTAAIVVLSAVTALLSGVGITFIVPIVELAQAGEPSSRGTGGLTGLFVTVYGFVDVPLTLETAVGGVASVITVRHVLGFLNSYFRAILRMDFVRELRLTAAENALSARIEYYDTHGSDEILNAIVTQADYAGGFIKNGVSLLESILVTLVYLGVAFYLAPRLTVLTASVFAALAVFIRVVFGSGYDAGENVARANEAVQETVQASTQGIRTVKLFGLGQRFMADIADAVAFDASALVRLRRNRAAFGELQRLASALTVFGLLYLGLAVFTIPLAQLAAFLFAMFRLAPRVTAIGDVFYRAEGDLPHVVRMREFIESLADSTEPTADDGNAARTPTEINGLSFENVRFGYDDEAQVLRGISLIVERPEFVALVGKSGAGKSTVVSLLGRLYEPDGGRIVADGTPIDRLPVDEWREHIAVVRQQPYVFDETLRFNLRVGNQEASEAALERACELAQITEFLGELPKGLDTELGDDGVRLSGGQRQRVAIARALLKNPDILVLDEATSDLDTGLETKVHRAIEEMDRDFMIIAIAHRLSTVINADRIHVFDDGEIVETGTHDELLAGDSRYAALYATQARI